MSIVSAKLDNVVLKNMRRRNFISVQRSVPGSDVAYSAGPRVVGFSATARRLAKKSVPVSPAPTGVPLYSLQRGTELVYASTPFYQTQKLKAPPIRGGGFDYESLVAQLDIPFDTPTDYAMGIRPGKRLLKVQEPPVVDSAPLFRSGK